MCPEHLNNYNINWLSNYKIKNFDTAVLHKLQVILFFQCKCTRFTIFRPRHFVTCMYNFNCKEFIVNYHTRSTTKGNESECAEIPPHIFLSTNDNFFWFDFVAGKLATWPYVALVGFPFKTIFLGRVFFMLCGFCHYVGIMPAARPPLPDSPIPL